MAIVEALQGTRSVTCSMKFGTGRAYCNYSLRGGWWHTVCACLYKGDSEDQHWACVGRLKRWNNGLTVRYAWCVLFSPPPPPPPLTTGPWTCNYDNFDTIFWVYNKLSILNQFSFCKFWDLLNISYSFILLYRLYGKMLISSYIINSYACE